MQAIHSTTQINKRSGQNCKLKTSMADFQIKGIVFNQEANKPFFNQSEITTESKWNRLNLHKFQSDTLLMGLRIRGLSIQSTTEKQNVTTIS